MYSFLTLEEIVVEVNIFDLDTYYRYKKGANYK